MPGFMPGIHVFVSFVYGKQDVDGGTSPAMTLRVRLSLQELA
jgi:hypothetical protein